MDYEIEWRPIPAFEARITTLHKWHGVSADTPQRLEWCRANTNSMFQLQLSFVDRSAWLCRVPQQPTEEEKVIIMNYAKARYGL